MCLWAEFWMNSRWQMDTSRVQKADNDSPQWDQSMNAFFKLKLFNLQHFLDWEWMRVRSWWLACQNKAQTQWLHSDGEQNSKCNKFPRFFFPKYKSDVMPDFESVSWNRLSDIQHTTDERQSIKFKIVLMLLLNRKTYSSESSA